MITLKDIIDYPMTDSQWEYIQEHYSIDEVEDIGLLDQDKKEEIYDILTQEDPDLP